MNAAVALLTHSAVLSRLGAFGARCVIAATIVLLLTRFLTARPTNQLTIKFIRLRVSAAGRHRLLLLSMTGLLFLPLLVLTTSGISMQVPVSFRSDALPALPPEASLHTEHRGVLTTEELAPPTKPSRDSALNSESLNIITASAEGGDANRLPADPPWRDDNERWISELLRRACRVFLLVWLAGSLATGAMVVADAMMMSIWVRQSVPISNAEPLKLFNALKAEQGIRGPVGLRCTGRFQVPMVIGNWRPVVLLPSGYGQWSQDRLRVVLLHELVHIRRRDVLSQYVAQLACAMYWFHPLVWLANRQMRIERELACDDAVVVAGEAAADYANHLVEIAAALQGRWRLPVSATAMASQTKLSQRVLHLLRSDIDRCAISKRLAGIQIMVSISIVVAAVCVAPSFAQTPSSQPLIDSQLAVASPSQEDASNGSRQAEKQDRSQKLKESPQGDTKETRRKRRLGARRKAALIEKYGGSEETEKAVERGLKWLSKQQKPDGSWELTTPPGLTNANESRRRASAATGMALMAIQGAGHTHQQGKYKQTVARGLNWLLKRQADNGEFRGQALYTHGICLNALAELYAKSGDANLREPAQRAVDFAVSAQDPKGGGWRYRPRQTGDMSVTGWFVTGLTAARDAGLDVPDKALELASHFLDSIQQQDGKKYPYIAQAQGKAGTTAIGFLCRQRIDGDPKTPGMAEGIVQLGEYAGFNPKRVDYYYWYHATQAFFNAGGKPWDDWNKRMRESLPASQVTTGEAAGSWPCERDTFASQNGPVYSTCLSVLVLEVYYRRPPALPEQ